MAHVRSASRGRANPSTRDREAAGDRERTGGRGEDPAGAPRLSCPFCESYGVDRMYLASLNQDSCQCASCGGRWDEDRTTGEYRGRAARLRLFKPRSD